MIEDKELRQLFEQESREHLDGLESGVMLLEKESADHDNRERIMREAHSLKGAARMLGLAEIELLSHKIETILRHHMDNTSTLDTATANTVLQAVDVLRSLSQTAIDDTPTTADVPAMAALLDSGATMPDAEVAAPPVSPPEVVPVPEAEARPEPVSSPQPKPAAAHTAPATPTPPQTQAVEQPSTQDQTAPSQAVEQAKAAIVKAERYRIDTIRVAPEKLDHLMTQVGELVVIQKRISGLQTALEDLNTGWEKLVRKLHIKAPTSLEQARDNDQAKLKQAMENVQAMLEKVTAGLTGDSARLDGVANRLEAGVRDVRMLPLATVFEQFRRMVHDISASLGKQVDLVIRGGETLADKRVVEEIKDPLMHLLRNALHHGIESAEERQAANKPSTGVITIHAEQPATDIVIHVNDDGRGLDLKKIGAKALRLGYVTPSELEEMSDDQVRKLIMRSGLTTEEMITDISGRGVGMDVVRTNVEGLKGDIQLDSQTGVGTQVSMRLPQSFATSTVILVDIQGQTFGIPIEYVQSVITIAPSALYEIEGQMALTHDGRVFSVVHGEDVLGLQHNRVGLPDNHDIPCILLEANGAQLGFLVGHVVDELGLVLKPTGALLKRVRHVLGVGILGTGEICTVLSPRDLVDTVHQRGSSRGMATAAATAGTRKKVLLAEDSMITRIQEKRYLEAAGYEVIATADGQEAWLKLNETAVDAVVSDILMPRMTGFELTEKIRANKRFADLPVILVTTLSNESDRRRGMQAGANGYIIKARFDPHALIDALSRLTGGTT